MDTAKIGASSPAEWESKLMPMGLIRISESAIVMVQRPLRGAWCGTSLWSCTMELPNSIRALRRTHNEGFVTQVILECIA